MVYLPRSTYLLKNRHKEKPGRNVMTRALRAEIPCQGFTALRLLLAANGVILSHRRVKDRRKLVCLMRRERKSPGPQNNDQNVSKCIRDGTVGDAPV